MREQDFIFFRLTFLMIFEKPFFQQYFCLVKNKTNLWLLQNRKNKCFMIIIKYYVRTLSDIQ